MSDCYESMSRTPIRDRPLRQPLIGHSRHPFVIPAPHFVIPAPHFVIPAKAGIQKGRPGGCDSPSNTPTNLPTQFSYLGVPAPAGMNACNEKSRFKRVPLPEVRSYRPMSSRITRLLTSLGLHSALATISILFLLPIIVVIRNSFASYRELRDNPLLIPTHISFGRYIDVWERASIPNASLNTIIITGTTVLMVVLLGSMAAFAFSRLDLPGNSQLFLLFMLALMLPSATLMVPLFRLNLALGTHNTYLAVIGPYIALGLPLGILLFKFYFDTLPREIEDSARVDGASPFTIYRHIMLPLARPVLAAVAIFQFLATWNEFVLAGLFLTKRHMYTLTVTAMMHRGNSFALFVIITLPVAIFFLLMQRQFISGLTAGALKG